MRKVILAGTGAIAVLVAGSLAVIVAVTGGGLPITEQRIPRDASTPEASQDLPAHRGSPPPVDGGVTFGEAPPPVTMPPGVTRPIATAPAKDSWEAVPITARAKSMGRLGGLIQARLNDLQDDLRTCFTAEGQSRHGGVPVTTVGDLAPMDDTGTLILVLQLEGQGGSVKVVDAPVETRGPAGDELIACAQSFFRGRTLDVPGVKAGAKYRLLYPMIP